MKTLTAFLIFVPFCFTNAQQIYGITPNFADAGETLDVTISGTNTFFTQATNTAIFFFFGSSSSTATAPNSFTVDNDNQITANLTVPAGTFQGWYDYSVYTDVIGLLYQTTSFQVFGEVNNLNNEVKGDFEAALFPNPNNGLLSIRLTNSNTPVLKASVFSSAGKQVHSSSLKTGDNQMDLDHLEKGVYFVKIMEGNAVRTYKIIKN